MMANTALRSTSRQQIVLEMRIRRVGLFRLACHYAPGLRRLSPCLARLLFQVTVGFLRFEFRRPGGAWKKMSTKLAKREMISRIYGGMGLNHRKK